MPRNPQSENRKGHVVSLVQQRLGPCHRKHSNRPDWYSSKIDAVDVFITDSKSTSQHAPWYDMKEKDLEELANHPAGFVLFVLGDPQRYLVIPARDLKARLPGHLEGPTEDGYYHFHVVRGKPIFKDLPAWNLTPYVDKLELIPYLANTPLTPR